MTFIGENVLEYRLQYSVEEGYLGSSRLYMKSDRPIFYSCPENGIKTHNGRLYFINGEPQKRAL